ncbi:MAG: hypothetical protein M5U28_21655 [Sandaracinaceae bacterium]|nr:hypothetical protein [Sandaracinaceae bacterium]
MHRRITTLLLAASALASVSLVLPQLPAAAESYARAFVNGRLVPVYFNDGDTFRVLEGEYRGSPCRLAGFNTLESYGPVHQWGDWHPYELYVNAKQATYNGRRGTWHCTTNGERDTYGRVLTDCPDLAIDQIRRGLAHAMEVDDRPSPPAYIRAQQAAIANRRGMWAHGVPDFVMTSLHSLHEDPGREYHYNRLVSTLDGHSESRQHRESYGECTWICNTETRVDEARIRAAARRLRESPALAPRLTELFNANLVAAVSRFVRKDELPESIPAELHEDLTAHLAAERAQGLLGETRSERGSCALYVEFQRRYGVGRAECLRDHGNWHGPPGGP